MVSTISNIIIIVYVKCRKLMEELIETEESYIKALQWVIDEYMPAMDNIEEVPRNLFGKKNYVFSTLPQLLQFNRL